MGGQLTARPYGLYGSFAEVSDQDLCKNHINDAARCVATVFEKWKWLIKTYLFARRGKPPVKDCPYTGLLQRSQTAKNRITSALSALPCQRKKTGGRLASRFMLSLSAMCYFHAVAPLLLSSSTLPSFFTRAITRASSFFPSRSPCRDIMMRCAWGEPAPCIDSVR